MLQLRGEPEDPDGVAIFNPLGKAIGFIKLPERCAKLCFGGPKNNRLYVASCHSLYALYVESHGAVYASGPAPQPRPPRGPDEPA